MNDNIPMTSTGLNYDIKNKTNLILQTLHINASKGLPRISWFSFYLHVLHLVLYMFSVAFHQRCYHIYLEDDEIILLP